MSDFTFTTSLCNKSNSHVKLSIIVVQPVTFNVTYKVDFFYLSLAYYVPITKQYMYSSNKYLKHICTLSWVWNFLSLELFGFVYIFLYRVGTILLFVNHSTLLNIGLSYIRKYLYRNNIILTSLQIDYTEETAVIDYCLIKSNLDISMLGHLYRVN